MTEKHCTLLLLKKDNKILLAMKKRGFGEGKWNGIGGKIGPHETVEQALMRETHEEIDVIPMHYWKVGQLDFHEFDKGKPHLMHVHIYLCDEWEREPSESEEMRPEWFETEKIPYSDMWSDDEYWLPHVLTGDKVIGEFHLDETDTIISHSVRIVDNLPDTPITSHA